MWRFHSGDFPEVDLGHSSYSVRMKGDEVRLMLDDDTWYAKTK
jgi:hypothetical protein